jgi:protocatechuate 3,4-dioxygenase beta subunit
VIASFDIDRTEPDFALAYRFDIVLRGYATTPFENQ